MSWMGWTVIVCMILLAVAEFFVIMWDWFPQIRHRERRKMSKRWWEE